MPSSSAKTTDHHPQQQYADAGTTAVVSLIVLIAVVNVLAVVKLALWLPHFIIQALHFALDQFWVVVAAALVYFVVVSMLHFSLSLVEVGRKSTLGFK